MVKGTVSREKLFSRGFGGDGLDPNHRPHELGSYTFLIYVLLQFLTECRLDVKPVYDLQQLLRSADLFCVLLLQSSAF